MVKKQKAQKAGSASATPKTKSPAKKNNNIPATAITPDEDVQAAEQKRAQLEESLWTIEKQIYELETRYLEQSNLRGNAVRGYEGFLNPAAGRMRRSAIKPDDRIFSNSSATGTGHLADQQS